MTGDASLPAAMQDCFLSGVENPGAEVVGNAPLLDVQGGVVSQVPIDRSSSSAA